MISEIHIFDMEEMWAHKDKIPSNARVISIVDPEEKFPPYKGSSDRVLQLVFDDIDETNFTKDMKERFARAGFLDPSECVLFSDEDADAVIEFVLECMDGRERIPIYVHCHAGFSRSPAVAQFIASVTYIGKNSIKRYDKPWSPNKLVESKLEERYRQRVMP